MSLTTDVDNLLAKLNGVNLQAEAIMNNYPVTFVNCLIGNGGYINTGYIPTNNTKYEITLSNTTNSNSGIFGADTAYDQQQTLFIVQGGEYRWYYIRRF